MLKDNVIHLAQQNAKGCYPIFEKEDVNQSLPYVAIHRTFIEPFNYHNHNCAVRMQGVVSYLTENVLPTLNHTRNLYFNIELNDINLSQHNTSTIEINFNNVLCFAKRREDNININVPLLPDYFFMQNWEERYKYIKDYNSWDIKKNAIVFVGSTTGNKDPSKNERIQACLWSVQKQHRDVCHFYISEFVCMNPFKVINSMPEIQQCVLSRYMTPKKQMEYRYILNIDGETCRWNPDPYFMNSLLFQTASNGMVWYTPLLKNKEHYVEVSFDENAPNYIMKMWNYYEHNPKEAQDIIRNANQLGKRLFTPQIGKLYTQTLFHNIIDKTYP